MSIQKRLKTKRCTEIFILLKDSTLSIKIIHVLNLEGIMMLTKNKNYHWYVYHKHYLHSKIKIIIHVFNIMN